jgi:hypothetical protein
MTLEQEPWIPDQNVFQWAETNNRLIHAMATYVRDLQLLGSAALKTNTDFFNTDLRTLSEMPLCGIWHYLKPPTGFVHVFNPVRVDRPDIKGQCPAHHYCQSDQDEIICLTPGLFVEGDNHKLKAGDRVRMLSSECPELIREYTDGIALLYGPRLKISTRLKIHYPIGHKTSIIE